MNSYKTFKALFVLPAVLVSAGLCSQSAAAQTYFAAPPAAVPAPRTTSAPVNYVEGAYTRVQNYRPATVAHLQQPRLQQPRTVHQPSQRFTGQIQSPQRYSHVPVRLAVRSNVRTAPTGADNPTTKTPAPAFTSNRTLLDARLMTGRVLR